MSSRGILLQFVYIGIYINLMVFLYSLLLRLIESSMVYSWKVLYTFVVEVLVLWVTWGLIYLFSHDLYSINIKTFPFYFFFES